MKPFLFTLIIAAFYYPIFAQQTYDCEPSTAFEFLEVNSVRARVNQGGDMWWNQTSHPYYQVPKPDSLSFAKNVLFAGALWMGGLDDSKTLRVAAHTYRQSGVDFWPGPIENESTNKETCSNFDRISNLHQKEIDEFKTSGIVTDNLKYYPAKNNPHLIELYGQSLPKDEDYAPFVDVNDDGKYNIDDGDYPDIKGDQSLYWIFNDLGNEHTESDGNPIGVEVKSTAYAYVDPSSIVDTTTFYRFDITNKSKFNYSDFVFGLYVDPDLGFYMDDLVGVDTLNNLAFAYNGDTLDEGVDGYGTNIPIVGITLLNAPYPTLENQSKLGAFVYYNNDQTDYGNPSNWEHYYNYLNAKWKDRSNVTYGEDGRNLENPPTRFMYTSNPADSSSTAWSECSVVNDPADRRFVLSSKPFNLPKGATASFEFAVVTSFDVAYPCPDISNFIKKVQFVQHFYDSIKMNIPTSTNQQLLPNNQVQLFPNPAKDVIQIVSDYTFKSAALFTVEGVEIMHSSLTKQNKLLLDHHLAKSIYLLKLQTEDGAIFTQKLLIE